MDTGDFAFVLLLNSGSILIINRNKIWMCHIIQLIIERNQSIRHHILWYNKNSVN